MGSSISASGAAAPALCAAISALELVNHLDPQRTGTGTMATAQAPALGGAVQAFLPLAAVGGLFTSVTLIYNHFHRAAAAVAGNRRLPELVRFMLCAWAGFLHFLLFVLQAPPGGVDPDAAARALGLAAILSVPAVATATYFLGALLIIVGHIRSGGEGGGGAVVVGDAPIEGPVGVGFLTKMATAATAALLCLMAMAVCFI